MIRVLGPRVFFCERECSIADLVFTDIAKRLKLFNPHFLLTVYVVIPWPLGHSRELLEGLFVNLIESSTSFESYTVLRLPNPCSSSMGNVEGCVVLQIAVAL